MQALADPLDNESCHIRVARSASWQGDVLSEEFAGRVGVEARVELGGTADVVAAVSVGQPGVASCRKAGEGHDTREEIGDVRDDQAIRRRDGSR